MDSKIIKRLPSQETIKVSSSTISPPNRAYMIRSKFLQRLARPISLGLAIVGLAVDNGSLVAHANLFINPCVPKSMAELLAGYRCDGAASVYKLTIYEAGLCQSNPTVIGGTIDRTTCTKVWENSSGTTLNISDNSTSLGSYGTVTQPAKGTYLYTYLLIGPTIPIGGYYQGIGFKLCSMNHNGGPEALGRANIIKSDTCTAQEFSQNLGTIATCTGSDNVRSGWTFEWTLLNSSLSNAGCTLGGTGYQTGLPNTAYVIQVNHGKTITIDDTTQGINFLIQTNTAMETRFTGSDEAAAFADDDNGIDIGYFEMSTTTF
jgi:hypothetical protein